MSNTKKCLNCGEWSKWNLDIHDECEHCGELLQKAKAKRVAKRIIERKKQDENFIFKVKENDNFLAKILKRGGHFVYLILMAIASFLSWLLFWLGP